MLEEVVAVVLAVTVVAVVLVVAVVVVLAFAFGLGMVEADMVGVDTTRRGLDSLAAGADGFLSLWRAGVSFIADPVLSVADSGDEDGLLDRNRNSGFRGESFDPRFTSFLELSRGEEEDMDWDEGGRSVEKDGSAGNGASFVWIERLGLGGDGARADSGAGRRLVVDGAGDGGLSSCCTNVSFARGISCAIVFSTRRFVCVSSNFCVCACFFCFFCFFWASSSTGTEM